MRLTQIRNATVWVAYGGLRFLVDPMLSPKGALPPCYSRVRPDVRNPLTDLPCPAERLLGADAVIVTHLHPGHFDSAAARLLPRTVPLFAQNRRDAEVLRFYGFEKVQVLGPATRFGPVTLTRTPGQHGNWEAEMLPAVDSVCGVVWQAPGEPCLYATGDTVWFPGVAQSLAAFAPDVILACAGGNMGYRHRINMDRADLLALHRARPGAVIVATHLEDLNHSTLTRADLQAFARENGFADRLRTPANGETLTFPGP